MTQTLFGYDSAAIAAQSRALDRLREATRERRIAAAPRRSWPLLLAIGRQCIRAGVWLQRTAHAVEQTMHPLAKEQVQ
jgi:hypothetical protein